MSLLQSTKKVVTGANNTTLAYGSSLTAGSLLCVTQSHFVNPAASISTPTDTLTHTYVPMTAEQSFTSGPELNALRGYYVANSSAGADTVTFDIAGSTAGDITMVVAEYSEVDTVLPLDQIAVGGGTGQIVKTAATGTISLPDELCWGGMTIGGASTGIDETEGNGTDLGINGYLLVQEDENGSTNMPISCSYKIVSTVTSYTASWHLIQSQPWICFIATFKLSTITVQPEPAQVYDFPVSQQVG